MAKSKFAIISEVHSNWEALKTVLSHIKENGGVDHIISAGDHFGYGPHPGHVTDALMELEKHGAMTAVPGNHDDVITGKHDASDFNHIARQSILQQMNIIADHHVHWTHEQPHVATFGSFGVTHGSMNPHNPYDYVNEGSSGEVDNELHHMDGLKLPGSPQHLIIGHTHVPGVGIIDPVTGKFHSHGPKSSGRPIIVPPGSRSVINPGSVGQPRDGDPRASYTTVESGPGGALKVTNHRVRYDVPKVQADIRARNIPGQNADRLALGR